MRVEVYDIKTWNEKFAKNAHIAVFEEENEPSNSRADFACLVIDTEKNVPIIYTTIAELNASNICMEFGGSFPDYRGTPMVKKAFDFLINFFREKKYFMVSFLTRNTNIAMLKLGMSGGFIVTGLNTSRDGIFLENTLYLQGDEK